MPLLCSSVPFWDYPEQMDSTIKRYFSFLDNGKTERECVKEAIALAEAKGYRSIDSFKKLQKGDRAYVAAYGKAIAFFQIGSSPMENGMNILGAHIDSPRLDIKMNPVYESDGVVYLDTHYYGGIKNYQWVALPLAVHGVICKTNGEKIEVSLGEDDDYSLCISDILPHMAKEQMKKTASEVIPGEDLDLIIGLDERSKEEKKGDKDKKDAAKDKILAIFKEKYGIEEKDFLSAELEAVPAGKARFLGLDKSMVLAYGQDDRVCAFTSLDALLETEKSERTSACILIDKEEIGSVGATGMDSMFFENATAEILDKMGIYSSLALRRTLRNSMMLSSDVNSAFDPLNASLYDKKNSSFLAGGVVFNKYTGHGGKSGASDASPEFIGKLLGCLEKNGVEFQMADMCKVDAGGGGTIAKYSAYYGMSVIDCGVAILSMHAPWEISAAKDILSAKQCYKAFLGMN